MPTSTVRVTCILTSGTTNASWQAQQIGLGFKNNNDYIPASYGFEAVDIGGNNRLWSNVTTGIIRIGEGLTTGGEIVVGSGSGIVTTSAASAYINANDIYVNGNFNATPAAISGTTAGTGTIDISARSAGYIGMPQNAEVATGTYSYTLTASDAGKHIYYTGTPTSAALVIPANTAVAFEIGTTIVVMNDLGAATNVSISITTNTLQLAGTGTTGTRTLARYGVATLVKVTATKWIISGNGLT